MCSRAFVFTYVCVVYEINFTLTCKKFFVDTFVEYMIIAMYLCIGVPFDTHVLKINVALS